MKIRVCKGSSCSCFGSESIMQAVSDATGLKPGEENDQHDLDYSDCLGWCSNSPNVEVDDSRVLFEAEPALIMNRIDRGDGMDSTGRTIDIDLVFENDILYTTMDTKKIMEDNNKKADEARDVIVPSDMPDDVSQGVRTKEDGEIRRVVVDRQACIGAGSCVVVTENLFQLDEENLAYVVDPDSHDQETIKLSAESCPVLAIHLYNKEGKKLFPEE
ncbi:MAG: hypothetical protein COU35_00950 [Candidatus Magasanikbacteria bacterium CG10_big_fil_rev_8_21_14_0_10_47_10]|uniref:Ferredoxin n=1 Tax=Candidatus Magasanikbacteria bacterium CG10_big_fil_rev_8_21_14_0_10_47_10 TaxID=1974652 RepID=A0A2H0TRC0_9BACT|nr:MAG: hypothetical protein COU35_00950 [Candidatus Magasanikbacteria bacterium CG10_big_fil_rev_8_21_14_0_10_47_10]